MVHTLEGTSREQLSISASIRSDSIVVWRGRATGSSVRFGGDLAIGEHLGRPNSVGR